LLLVDFMSFLDYFKNKKRNKFRTEIVREFDEKIYRDILKIRKKSYEDDFLFEDEEEYFKVKLHDKKTIHVLLKSDGKNIGYLLAVDHNEAQSDIGDDDKRMQKDNNRFYIDTMSINPKYRGNFGFLQMVFALIKEAKKRGTTKFSSHVRKTNNLSKKIQLLFGNSITELRHIDNWKYAGGEPYDYIEGDFNKSLLNLKSKILVYKILKKCKSIFSSDLKIDEIYTPIEVAKKEIWKRWNDKKLKKEVIKFIGDLPEQFGKEPLAALFRFIATPDFEYMRAKDLSSNLGLKLIYLEYLNDKFCTRNKDKLNLGKLYFFHGKKNNYENLISKKRIFNLQDNDGRPFKDIKLESGASLVDFHHKLFQVTQNNSDFLDISKWARERGKNATETYPFFMALFTCFGILLEGYDIKSKDEKEFAKNVILPAFEKIQKKFGVRPLIVRLYNKNEESSFHWYCHPAFLLNYIKKIENV